MRTSIFALIVSVVFIVGCDVQPKQRAQLISAIPVEKPKVTNQPEVEVVLIRPGQKIMHASMDSMQGLTYLTRPMREGEKPEECTLRSELFGIGSYPNKENRRVVILRETTE